MLFCIIYKNIPQQQHKKVTFFFHLYKYYKIYIYYQKLFINIYIYNIKKINIYIPFFFLKKKCIYIHNYYLF